MGKGAAPAAPAKEETKAAAPAAKEEPKKEAKTSDNGPPEDKEDLYRLLAGKLNTKVEQYFEPVAKRVKDQKNMDIKMRQVFGDQDIRDLTVAIFDGLFDILLQDVDPKAEKYSTGIPGGYGSLQLMTAAATTKKTPQGQLVPVKKRWRVKYSPGKSVDERLAKLPAPIDEKKAEPVPAAAPAAK